MSAYISHPQRIALMGGTFDPIHYGHLVTAETARNLFDLDMALFIPSGSPPHKQSHTYADAEARYEMCQLATASNPYFSVSRIEIDRKGSSYTIETIRQLKAEAPDGTQFCFIVGADAYHDIPRWYQGEEILKTVDLIVATRPGYIREPLPEAHPNIRFIEVPGFDISSTEIRRRIRTHASARYLLPEAVEAYIARNHLYEEEEESWTTIRTSGHPS